MGCKITQEKYFPPGGAVPDQTGSALKVRKGCWRFQRKGGGGVRAYK